MSALPLTVLLHNGPIGRAYLAMLSYAGYKVDRIVVLVYRNHPSTGKPMGRWIPIKPWRVGYLAWAQDVLLNHWARYIERRHPDFHKALTASVARDLEVPVSFVESLTEPSDWRSYAKRVEYLLVDGLGDAKLRQHVAQDAGDKVVLYTGGGLVPKPFLEIEGLKVLHIHPGWLPDVRGADGLLWSVLVRGKPAASCFYMDAGLDTGEVVERAEFAPLFLGSQWLRELDQKLLYRAIYAFVDPVVRARVLGRVLEKNRQLGGLSGLQQSPSEGVVFHFMHPTVQRLALSCLFRDP